MKTVQTDNTAEPQNYEVKATFQIQTLTSLYPCGNKTPRRFAPLNKSGISLAKHVKSCISDDVSHDGDSAMTRA